MTTYYRTTTPNQELLKLTTDEEMYVWENGRWELSFFWWEAIRSSGFTAYEEISEQKAVEMLQDSAQYA